MKTRSAVLMVLALCGCDHAEFKLLAGTQNLIPAEVNGNVAAILDTACTPDGHAYAAGVTGLIRFDPVSAELLGKQGNAALHWGNTVAPGHDPIRGPGYRWVAAGDQLVAAFDAMGTIRLYADGPSPMTEIGTLAESRLVGVSSSSSAPVAIGDVLIFPGQGGVMAFDFTDLQNGAKAGSASCGGTCNLNTLRLQKPGILWGISADRKSMFSFDVSTPKQPVATGSWSIDTAGHPDATQQHIADYAFLGNRLYVSTTQDVPASATINAGLYVIDVSNPMELKVVTLPGEKGNQCGGGKLTVTPSGMLMGVEFVTRIADAHCRFPNKDNTLDPRGTFLTYDLRNPDAPVESFGASIEVISWCNARDVQMRMLNDRRGIAFLGDWSGTPALQQK